MMVGAFILFLATTLSGMLWNVWRLNCTLEKQMNKVNDVL